MPSSPSVAGSPPQVWGQRVADAVQPISGGFTPTSVGTTRSRGAHGPLYPVHPHKCGDNGQAAVPCQSHRGSPPQVWGQLLIPMPCHIRVRFTPTSVGTTGIVLWGFRKFSVHPHKCGDNSRTGASPPPAPGSPPQVWGQLPLPGHHWACDRFTPTSVGTTCMASVARLPGPVHPHKCGDNAGGNCAPVHSHGSPPQVWGQLPATRHWRLL